MAAPEKEAEPAELPDATYARWTEGVDLSAIVREALGTTPDNLTPLLDDMRAATGMGPLHWAAIRGNTHLLRAILRTDDTEVDARDAYGRSALDLAIEYSRYRNAALLTQVESGQIPSAR